MKTILNTILLVLVFQSTYSQTDTAAIISVDTSVMFSPVSADDKPVYRLNNAIDIPLTAATTAYTLWGFSKIYRRDKTPESVILALNPQNVNSFDRPATGYHSQSAKNASDKFFYGSMPFPLIFLLDKKMRQDGWKLGLLYLQAVSSFGSLYASSAMLADRFRPYTYNPNVEISRRTGGGGKNSFFAGHPGMVATVAFFSAKVYSDYHPQMRNKWILYTLAGTVSATTGILRVKAGEHFTSDVLVGVPVGVITGILVPHIHKNREKSLGMTVLPTYRDGQPGFYATFKLD